MLFAAEYYGVVSSMHIPNLLAGITQVHSELSLLTNPARLNLQATRFMAGTIEGIIKTLKSSHRRNMMTQGEGA